MPRKKTLARKLFTGILMEASDERVNDMYSIVNEYDKESPLKMTALRVIPFVDDLINVIRSEYKYRSNKNKKK